MTSLLIGSISLATVFLFGSIGEIITEKSGNLNLGIPGIMYMGGIAGLMGAFFYENGNANPSIRTLKKLAAAMNMALDIKFVPLAKV